ncbi:MAG: phosphotransferase [Alphaproteobacteria bacterium]|nr:phosphotransferase [Alphaproteobacteria bacterium]MDP6831802.1 phosphotransferase [Alphaproteobacteria bacterium]
MDRHIGGPALPGDITSGWLTQALRTNPELAGAEVTDFKYDAVIGEGLTSTMGRLHLTYADPRPDCPKTLFLKQKILVPDILAFMAKFKIYAREVLFYQTFAAENPLNPPRCYYAWIDDDDADFALLLEDLGKTSTLGQWVGHDLGQAKAAIAKLGMFHGDYQGRADVAAADWAPDFAFLAAAKAAPRGEGERLSATFGPAFVKKHGHRVTPFLSEHAVEISDQAPSLYASFADHPRTLLHGDFHCANMSVSATDVRVYDWQVIRRGPGVCDLLHYLSWMRRDLRDANLDDLLGIYFQNFTAQLAGSYDWEVFRNHLKFGLLLHVEHFIMLMGGPFGKNEAGERLADFWCDTFNPLSEQFGLAETWADFLRGERPIRVEG